MHCECQQDGFCKRYGKEMRGRLREICRGENVDVGTAANYRALWLSESKTFEYAKCPFLGDAVVKDGENVKSQCVPCGGKPRQLFSCLHPARQPDEVTIPDCLECDYRPRKEPSRRLILKNHLSPGDVLVMSAAIYSLHQSYPGEFSTAVDTTANAFYDHNPNVSNGDGELVEMHYPAIHQCNQRAIHFMQGYCDHLAEVIGKPVPLMTNRPHVYLSKQERGWMNQVQEVTGRKQRFWLICAGRKGDYTAKHWGTSNFQDVVDRLRGKVLFVQVGAIEHYHKPLKGVVDLIGKTDLRQLIRLAWHADGVLCGVTMLQHLAAALEKPSVVIMGGREPVTWNSYPRQQLMHTVGSLSCCRSGGCWKSRVEPLPDGDAEKNASLCDNPILGDEAIGKCMALIRPEEVAERILLTVANQ